MKSRIDLSHWLYNVAIAHRGLFDNEHPENTISAYEKAIENGQNVCYNSIKNGGTTHGLCIACLGGVDAGFGFCHQLQ